MLAASYSAPQAIKAAAIATNGYFSGYAVTFGHEDWRGYIIDRGAFTKTLQEMGPRIAPAVGGVLFPLLWQNAGDDPIGGITRATQDATGPRVEGFIDLDSETGQRAYRGVKEGYVRGLSVGYDPIKLVDRSGQPHVTEARLMAVGLVTFLRTPGAEVTQIKAAGRSTPNLQEVMDTLWMERIASLLKR